MYALQHKQFQPGSVCHLTVENNQLLLTLHMERSTPPRVPRVLVGLIQNAERVSCVPQERVREYMQVGHRLCSTSGLWSRLWKASVQGGALRVDPGVL